MKVFVSWSGSVSQTVAKTLHQYIPVIIQSADVFFSQEDIEKGANWDSILQEKLSNSSYGIVCLTPQNIDAPWINFEAGAIAKTLDSRVSSLLIGVNPSDLNGPLTRFQATRTNRGDFFKLIQGINRTTDHPLDNSLLERSFDASWPKIEESLRSAEEAALKAQRSGKSYSPSEPNPQELILQTVRDIASQISSPENLIPPSYIASVFSQISCREPIASRGLFPMRAATGTESETESELLSFIIDFMLPIVNTLSNADPQTKKITIPMHRIMDSIRRLMCLLSSIDLNTVPDDLKPALDNMLRMIRVTIVKFDVCNDVLKRHSN